MPFGLTKKLHFVEYDFDPPPPLPLPVQPSLLFRYLVRPRSMALHPGPPTGNKRADSLLVTTETTLEQHCETTNSHKQISTKNTVSYKKRLNYFLGECQKKSLILFAFVESGVGKSLCRCTYIPYIRYCEWLARQSRSVCAMCT